MHKIIVPGVLAPMLFLVAVGCKKPAAPAAPQRPASAPALGFRPDLIAAGGDAELGAAQATATTILDGLLAGRYDADADLSPVARKVKGFASWSVDAQERGSGRPAAWHFRGTLNGPHPARFDMYLVKQQAGHWAVGSFSGPSAIQP